MRRTNSMGVVPMMFRRAQVDLIPPPRVAYRGVYARLYVKLLEEALEDVKRPHDLSMRPHRVKAYRMTPYCPRCTVEEWINGVDQGGLLFVDVCDELGLEPSAVRRAHRGEGWANVASG